MKSRQTYFGIIVVSVIIILVNTTLVYVDEYLERKEERIHERKVEILTLGKELQDVLLEVDQLFYFAQNKGNIQAIDALKEMLQWHLGVSPRPASLVMFPSIKESHKDIISPLLSNAEQQRKLNETVGYFQAYLEWAIKTLENQPKTNLSSGNISSAHLTKFQVKQHIDGLLLLTLSDINTNLIRISKSLYTINHVMIFMTVMSVLFFGITILFLLFRLLNPYFENKGKLASVGEQMYSVGNMAFWEYDLQRNIYRGGREFANFFGLDKEEVEISREEMLEIMTPESVKAYLEKNTEILDSKATKASYEVEFVDFNGRNRIMNALGEYVYSNDGTLVRRHGVIQDVTSLKQIEQELQLSQGKLDEVLYQLEIGVAEVVPVWKENAMVDIKFQDVNDAFCRIFKQPDSEIHGKNYSEVFQFFGNSWVRLMSRKIKDNFKTYTSVIYNGTLNKWLKVKIYRESNFRIIAFVEDITQEHNTRINLRKSQERMELSENMARFGYCEIDVKNKTVDGNLVAFEIHGLQRIKNLKLDQFLKVVIEEDRPVVVGLWDNLLRKNRAEGTYRVVVNEETRYINCKLENVKSGKKRTHAFGFVHDVTSTKEFENELTKAKEKAEESDRLKSAFLANMSHEIRTPLSAIVGFSNILAKNELADDLERIECQSLIEKNSKSLMVLINDVVEMAKIESGEIHMNPTTFEVNQFIDDVYAVFSAELVKKGRSTLRLFTQKASEKDLYIITDANRLNQITNNLISNAIKFTPKGFVEFGYAYEDKELIFFVRDSGIGIEEDKKEVIFKMFRQADLDIAGEYGGTGLGLSISQKLIELMGGKIWVESIVGVGSTFFYSIPLGKGVNVKTTLVPPKKVINVERPDFSNRVILIADDEDFIHVLFKNFLLGTGAKILNAKNGVATLEILEKEAHVDIVLLDMRMPKLNGEATIKEIRLKNKSIPVIAQTAYAFIGDQERFIKAGCTDYLSKPIKEEELLNKLAKYLT